jgi:hypothetical protein
MIANSRQPVSSGYTKLSPIMRKIELKIEAKRSQFSMTLVFLFSIYSVFNYCYGCEGTGTTRGLIGVTWWKGAALNQTEASATLPRQNTKRFT